MSILVVTQLKGFDFKKQAYELHTQIEKIKLKDRGKKEVGALKGFVYSIYSDKYVYVKLYKEFRRKAGFFNGDPEQLEEFMTGEGEYKSLLIDSRGCMLYEVSRFFHSSDIKELIDDVFKKCGLDKLTFEDVTNFDLKTMRAFYKSANKVKHLKIKSVGKVEPNPRMPPQDVEEAVQDMGNQVSSVSLESGKMQNLKGSQIINDGLARRSDLLEVRGLDENRASFTISKNGRIITSLPKESHNTASKMYKICEKIFSLFQ